MEPSPPELLEDLFAPPSALDLVVANAPDEPAVGGLVPAPVPEEEP